MSIKSSSYDYHLLKGSHDFPGNDGGACLNEVAAVVAGYEYRSIMTHRDAPACFCPVLTEFSISVNDAVSHEYRQTMKKFVVRMAGSKDNTVAKQRAEVIALGVCQKIVPLALSHLPEFAERFRSAKNLAAVHGIIRDLNTAFENYCTSGSPSFATYFQYIDGLRFLGHLPLFSRLTTWAGEVMTKSLSMVADCYRDQIMQIAIDLIEEGLAIGRQAPPIPDVEALLRWSAASQLVRETA